MTYLSRADRGTNISWQVSKNKVLLSLTSPTLEPSPRNLMGKKKSFVLAVYSGLPAARTARGIMMPASDGTPLLLA